MERHNPQLLLKPPNAMLVTFSRLEKGLKEVAVFLGKRIDAASSSKDIDLSRLLNAISRVEKAVKDQKTPDFSGTVKVDQTDILRELRNIASKVEKMEMPMMDDSKLLGAIKSLQKTLESQKPVDYEPLLKAIQSIKLAVPETMKLDQAQVDRIAMAGGHTTDHVRAGRTVTVANVSMTTANTEYTYKFPGRTIAWELRLRSTDVPLLIAYTTGKLPTSGDGGAYFTVPAYYLQTNSGMDWGNRTVYIQTASASQVLEVISYQA
jgi:hypothetical protein